MLEADPQFARSDVLRVFNHAQIYLFLGAAIITSGIVSTLFVVLRRRLDPVLLWFALLAVLYGGRLEVNYQLLWALGLRPLGFQRVVIAVGFLVPIPAFFFFRELNLLGRAGRIACAIVWPVASVLAFATLLLGPRSAFHTINNGFIVTALVIIFIALVRAGSENRDLGLIRLGLFLFIACAVYDNVTMFVGRYDNIEPFSFVVLLFCLGIVAARRTLANEQNLTVIQQEIESASIVQGVLIPSGTPEVVGFSIASIYKPASQVGGDFFQIIPDGKGGVLVVIGDVSGKGMPAAMTVALLVGTIRTLAHYTRSPREILSAMNARMLGRSAGGFTTCLVLRADSDGTLTVANAGHIAPYLNRLDLQLENGLPLGLDAGSTYVESTYRLAQDDQLTLMTDGVIEARNRGGELYGFDRAARIASESAESIARAAQEFGQEDDITVVTLVRQRVEASADTPLSTRWL